MTELPRKSQDLLTFPCLLPVKIMGPNQAAFVATVTTVIQAYDPEYSSEQLTTRLSKTAKYISLTCRIQARSRDQVDAIYRALSALDEVKYLL